MRFKLFILKDSNDTWGWNGYVKDTATNWKYPLHKVVVDYIVDDEIGHAICAFDTKAELTAAATRKVRQILASEPVAA